MIKRPSEYTQKGQSLVEFSLTATLLIFLAMSILDFGMAFMTWIILRDAAQEGATYGSIFPPVDKVNLNHPDEGYSLVFIRARVRESATAPISLDTYKTHVYVSLLTPNGLANGQPCQQNAIQVRVTYDYHFVSPMTGKIFGNIDGNIPITASVTNTILVDGDKNLCAASP